MALITFTDKVTLEALPDIDAVNKLTAADVNHIKTVVNANAAIVEAALLALKWKAPVKVATTANGTLASAFANGQTVDGVSLVTGDRILLKNQSDQTANGIYTVNASGAPTRATDADSAAELEGAAVLVQQGTTNANTSWQQTTDGITLGSSNVVWATLGTGLPTAAQVPFTPAGNLSATDVQAMGQELDTKKVALINAAVALTDAASIDLTAIKHTLATADSRTFTISYTGDDITLIVTLNAVSATQTFPATALCVSEGIATGDNTCPMSGVSGDKYAIAIKRIGSDFIVVCKNVGQ